jgi:hypothetical protein
VNHVEAHDPKGRVFCDDCERSGRPRGGVRTTRKLSAIHIRFELPEGWTLDQEGALRCTSCTHDAAQPSFAFDREVP